MLHDDFGASSDTIELKEGEEISSEDEKLDLSDEEDPYASDGGDVEEENYMNFAVMKEMYPNGEQEYSF